MISVASGLIARLQGLPLSLAVMGAFPVFVVCLHLLELPAFIKGTTEIEGQRLPDPELWKAMDRYSLGQAACLMANVPIRPSCQNQPCRLAYCWSRGHGTGGCRISVIKLPQCRNNHISGILLKMCRELERAVATL
jgi:hypothetical protein